jgi:hypothetical protein
MTDDSPLIDLQLEYLSAYTYYTVATTPINWSSGLRKRMEGTGTWSRLMERHGERVRNTCQIEETTRAQLHSAWLQPG